MSPLRKNLPIKLAITLSLGFLPEAAYSCTRLYPSNFQDIEKADYVVVGQKVKNKENSKHTFLFSVNKSTKGDIKGNIKISFAVTPEGNREVQDGKKMIIAIFKSKEYESKNKEGQLGLHTRPDSEFTIVQRPCASPMIYEYESKAGKALERYSSYWFFWKFVV